MEEDKEAEEEEGEVVVAWSTAVVEKE